MAQTMEFNSNIEDVAQYAKKVVEAIPGQHYSKRKLYRMRLAIDEALTNAIMHGNQCDIAKKVVVESEDIQNGIAVSITDEGPGFDYHHTPTPTDDDNLLQIGGRGIFIVNHYADDISYTDPGNRVTLVFHYDQPGGSETTASDSHGN
ncbi:ATP-binding protein [Desulfurispira natronophila]|uniref:Serine/threonine-protein kinase RsbW n=1 Tax=Desulfurispira natronophila TaxID=682562 RepID=A0A7W8DHL9_9BACT|nr:ATP-binding protein [Desulfurispira natronophila]MBB5022696.1 serine/threonine-protein kinase RsbW [Desulfurispira natronophila]